MSTADIAQHADIATRVEANREAILGLRSALVDAALVLSNTSAPPSRDIDGEEVAEDKEFYDAWLPMLDVVRRLDGEVRLRDQLRQAADRMLASLRAVDEPLAAPALLDNRRRERAERADRSSSQAGIASFTGRHFPPRPVEDGERPCGHRDEDACEACVPGDGGAA